MSYSADVSSAGLTPALTDPFVPAPTAGAVSWGAIVAGAVAAVATTLILLAIGAGVGLSMISPWSGVGASAGTVGVSAVVGLVVTQWVASGIGGFLAGRLRSKWASLHTHEVFFRDTAHGFLSWALATVVGALLFASVTATGVSGVAKGGADVAAAGAMGAAQGAAGKGDSAGDANGYFIDTLYRSNNAADDKSDPRAETGRILVRSTHNGQVALSPEDKTYLAQLVAGKTGLSPQDAGQRVDTVVAQINDAAVKAKQAADVARKRAAQLAIVSALAMLVGAFIAATAGAIGGGIRDEF
jgi:hypothetical protein